MPDRNTDAAAAGQTHIQQQLKNIMTSPAFLFYVYFWGWPIMRDKMWPPMIGPQLPPPPTEWSDTIIKTVSWGLICLVALLLYVFFKQESILYVVAQPLQYVSQNPARYQSPAEREMKHEEVTIVAKDGIKLQAWFLYQEKKPEMRDTVIFLHENAGNIGLRMDYFEILYKQLKVNIVAVAYRGYSNSEGSPNEEGLIMDAEATIEFCKNEARINNDKVFLIGRSLGGAVAVHVAAEMSRKKDLYLNGVIIESTFTSIDEMASRVFPFLKILPESVKQKMTRLRWKSIDHVPDIAFPVLYIAGDSDSFVPTFMTDKLYSQTNNAPFKDIFIVEGGDHNNTFLIAGDRYKEKLSCFFNRAKVHFKRGLEEVSSDENESQEETGDKEEELAKSEDQQEEVVDKKEEKEESEQATEQPKKSEEEKQSEEEPEKIKEEEDPLMAEMN